MTGPALVWAQSTAGVIGRDGGIPWHIPEDLAHFKELTLGHPVIMGRLTWDSLPARFRPLPGRRNLVLTRDPHFVADGAEVITSLDDAPLTDAWVIGGAQVYALALPAANRCEVTEVDIDLPGEDGDALAPVLDDTWVGSTGDWSRSSTGLRYRFVSYRR